MIRAPTFPSTAQSPKNRKKREPKESLPLEQTCTGAEKIWSRFAKNPMLRVNMASNFLKKNVRCKLTTPRPISMRKNANEFDKSQKKAKNIKSRERCGPVTQ